NFFIFKQVSVFTDNILQQMTVLVFQITVFIHLNFTVNFPVKPLSPGFRTARNRHKLMNHFKNCTCFKTEMILLSLRKTTNNILAVISREPAQKKKIMCISKYSSMGNKPMSRETILRSLFKQADMLDVSVLIVNITDSQQISIIIRYNDKLPVIRPAFIKRRNCLNVLKRQVRF